MALSPLLETAEGVAPALDLATALKCLVAAIKAVRVDKVGLTEFEIRDLLLVELIKRDIPFQKEQTFHGRLRADILVEPRILVEIKKSKPPTASLERQLQRYAATGEVNHLLLVLERSVLLPARVGGVPCSVISLNSLWGIAV